jgi:hypothetical protein
VFIKFRHDERRPCQILSPNIEKFICLGRNRWVIITIDNMAVITDIKVADLTNEGNSQIYTLCAANHRSTIRVLRHGLAVSEMAVSDLPATPNVVLLNLRPFGL